MKQARTLPATATAAGRGRLTGTFGPIEIAVPRARLNTADGKTTGSKSEALRAYQRRTLAADALIASTLSGRHQHTAGPPGARGVFGGAVGKDTVSRVWRKVKTDWDAWNGRSLADRPEIVRLILDGTVVRVRLDRKATSISLLVVIGVREDGQKVLLAIKSMGGESAEAWRAVLDDLIKRGLRRPEFLIVDGAPGHREAIAAIRDGGLPRCRGAQGTSARDLLASPGLRTTLPCHVPPDEAGGGICRRPGAAAYGPRVPIRWTISE